VLAHGQVKSIDVGQANNEHYFFEAAGVGIDAALFPWGEEIKGGRWGRMLQAAQLAMGYEPQRLSIQLDRPISEAREQPSDGGDLCGSGQIPPGASCASKPCW